MPVKPVPSAIGGLVVEVDVAAAGSVVVLGEGDAWRPEALGAPSQVGSFVRSCPCSSPSYASSPFLLALSSLPLHRLRDHDHLLDRQGPEGRLESIQGVLSRIHWPMQGLCRRYSARCRPSRCLRRWRCLHVSVLLSWIHLLSPFRLYLPVLGALDVRHGFAAGAQRQAASCYQKSL